MDDIIVLVESKKQYLTAKRKLFAILRKLKLQISPHKTKMGRLRDGFHFLGVDFEVTPINETRSGAACCATSNSNVDFEVTRIPQSETQVKTQVTIHSRTCRRALDKVIAMKTDAVHPAKIQRYLVRWATWWDPVTRLGYWSILQKWVNHTTADQPAVVWIGRGLLPPSYLT